MHFDMTDEQRQLRDSLRRLLEKEYGFAERRRLVAGEPGWSADVWRQLAHLGVTGIGVPAELSGLGGDALDRLVVHGELGRVLSLEPYLGSAVLAGTLAQAAGGEYARAVLPGMVEGSRLLALAHAEPGARHAGQWIESRARREGDRWLLDGEKIHVLHGASADELLVSARLSGGPDAADGIAVFRLPGGAEGATLEAHRLLDGSPAAALVLRAAPAQLLLEGRAASAALGAATRAGIAAACAEGVGVMQGAFDLTVAYLGERRQFGQPIGSYQALRHRVAEMKVGLETARSAALAAAMALADGEGAHVDAELSRAKLMLSRHGTHLTQQAIQLHGGIGMTDEYPVGHYLRRLTVLDQLFGDAGHHARRLAGLLRQAHAHA